MKKAKKPGDPEYDPYDFESDEEEEEEMETEITPSQLPHPPPPPAAAVAAADMPPERCVRVLSTQLCMHVAVAHCSKESFLGSLTVDIKTVLMSRFAINCPCPLRQVP